MTISRLRTIWYRIVAAAVATAVPIVVVISTLAMPAAAQTSGFGDVPDDAYFTTPVADLHAEGVFNDTLCEEGFCPGVPIDRRTMAVWTIRVLDGQDPPAITQSRFDDVDPASYHAPFIERMAELEVTRGCGDPSRFCPDRNVTRAEMAAFLSRAFNLLDAANPGFDDVPDGAWYASDVAKLAASEITVGCGGTRFCPDRNVTRAEMATFLHRAISGGGGQISETERDVLGASRSRATEIERDTASIDLEVHYCGQSENGDYTMSDLMTDTELIRNTVKGIGQFYLRQSGSKSRINISAGTLLWPDIDWDDPNTNLGYWQDQVFDYWDGGSNDPEWEYDPCADELQDKGYDPAKALILADVETGGIAGYAYDFGVPPAVAATVNRRGGNEEKYLGTVAHEIGHASYRWYHPWDDKYSNYSGSSTVRKQRLKDQADAMGEGSEEHHLAESIMSYNSLGRLNNLTPGRSDSAYVACYQRKLTLPQWVKDDADHRNCELLATRPAKPTSVDVSSGNRSLTVSWVQPVAGSDDIERYYVYYRSINGGWIKWKPNDVITSRSVTIDGLTNGVTYQVRVAAENGVGIGTYSDLIEGTPGDESPIIILTVGDRVKENPDCTDPNCRWLHIDTEGFGPGPHSLACVHDGVHQTGASRGVFESTDVDSWPANRACFFQHPLNKVFVIVGAERRGDTWYGGTYSAEIPWPDSDPAEVRIAWGTDASTRSSCPSTNTDCRNLNYEYIGDWGPPPYSVECWGNGQRTAGPFQWSGRPHTGCYYWGGTAQVVINGVRSNTIPFPGGGEQTTPTTEVRIAWGTDASTRSSCPSTNTDCRNLNYEYIGDWGPPPYSVECWGNGQRTAGPFQWSGRPHTGCYYWGGTAQVVINGVPSNELQWEGSEAEVPDRPTVRATVDGTTIEASWFADDNGSRIDKWEIRGRGEVSASTTSSEWTNQQPGSYRVRVRAHNQAGWSEWGTSNRVTVTDEADDEVPDQPTVRATVDGTTIEASWFADDNGSRIDKWEIRGRGEVSASTTSGEWTNQQPGSYRVRVRAHNQAGWSEWGTSNRATVTGQTYDTVAYDAGSAVGNRWNWNPSSDSHAKCERAVICRNVGVSNLSDFSAGPPYQLECWFEGDSTADWSGPWSGAANSGCYFWTSQEVLTVYVKVNGVESNKIVLRPS